MSMVTREVLHRVGAHVLARRRFQAVGRFGLRVLPGGIATPLFGDELIRTSGATLVHEVGGRASYRSMDGASLRELAAWVGADIDAEFSCGEDTPEIGDPDAPLGVDRATAEGLATWMAQGARALDGVIAGLSDAEPETLQLWPEHFDLGTNVAVPSGGRVNLGCSHGDGYEADPYVYVGPWGPERPGDAAYWNAPFGAVLTRSTLGGGGVDGLAAFFSEGLGRFS